MRSLGTLAPLKSETHVSPTQEPWHSQSHRKALSLQDSKDTKTKGKCEVILTERKRRLLGVQSVTLPGTSGRGRVLPPADTERGQMQNL